MPVIKVEMFSGRTKEQKSELGKKITEAFVEAAGGTAESVHVIFCDIDKENWCVAGQLCSDRPQK